LVAVAACYRISYALLACDALSYIAKRFRIDLSKRESANDADLGSLKTREKKAVMWQKMPHHETARGLT
jgi:hypothetical protein